MSQLTFLEQLTRERRPLSVSQLTAQLKELIEDHFSAVWVEGEISNFRRHSSGHWYFSLKDEGATLRCACFRMQNRLIRFSPEDGMNVRARGGISLYEPRGDYQLLVEYLEPVGVGALQLAFEQLKTNLAAEGLFDAGRKRSLPVFPARIGIVTSPTGAALQDILRTIKRRNEAVSILVAPARVQGEGAGTEVARAIELLNARREVDVIIVGRGGGSVEDLWPFNEECVARAIYSSRAPVISAVGHETDSTIADFVADLRASTPSAAAEIVAMALDDISARVAGLREGMTGSMRYRILETRSRLSKLEASPAFKDIVPSLRTLAQRVDSASFSLEGRLRRGIKLARARIEAATLRLRGADTRRVLGERRAAFGLMMARATGGLRTALDRSGERLSIAAGKLQSLSPLGVLARGYAIAFDGQGRIIKRADAVPTGERVRVRVAEGEMECEKK
ncbi:MAG TPA: exodeoxyribonuclease VII large subunit [Blastocatellia bacterium]|nr:exodeoxyribonuclease VII large subunit [Blastocatellia bacterium]